MNITPILRSLHWLNINEYIEYILLSLTYKVLTTSQPDYQHNLISVHSSSRTRSSSAVTLSQTSVSSSLQITNRSFTYASPAPFFIPSTSLCSLSSWFTSSCAYHLITVITIPLTIYTVSQKTCDYIFYNNFNNKCPITIIFGTVSSQSRRHRKMVSFPTSPI